MTITDGGVQASDAQDANAAQSSLWVPGRANSIEPDALAGQILLQGTSTSGSLPVNLESGVASPSASPKDSTSVATPQESDSEFVLGQPLPAAQTISSMTGATQTQGLSPAATEFLQADPGSAAQTQSSVAAPTVGNTVGSSQQPSENDTTAQSSATTDQTKPTTAQVVAMAQALFGPEVMVTVQHTAVPSTSAESHPNYSSAAAAERQAAQNKAASPEVASGTSGSTGTQGYFSGSALNLTGPTSAQAQGATVPTLNARQQKANAITFGRAAAPGAVIGQQAPVAIDTQSAVKVPSASALRYEIQKGNFAAASTSDTDEPAASNTSGTIDESENTSSANTSSNSPTTQNGDASTTDFPAASLFPASATSASGDSVPTRTAHVDFVSNDLNTPATEPLLNASEAVVGQAAGIAATAAKADSTGSVTTSASASHTDSAASVPGEESLATAVRAERAADPVAVSPGLQAWNGGENLQARLTAAHAGGLRESEMNIAMRSEALGSVELRAHVSGDVVGASIGIERHDARAMISNDLPALHQALHERQLKVGDVSVFQGPLSSGNGGAGGRSSQQREAASQHPSGTSGWSAEQGGARSDVAAFGDNETGTLFDSSGRLSVRA